MELLHTATNRRFSQQQIVTIRRGIYAEMLEESPYLHRPNFTRLHSQDLKRMFELYDEHFFDGQASRSLNGVPLSFRVSKRMTSAGGKTTRTERLVRGQVKRDYEITVSGVLLFESFQIDDRPITVTGSQCHNRLEAMQRVMEHEMIHLIEMMVWRDSNCSGSRFQSIARRFFNHNEHGHRLITPRERAYTDYGIQQGDAVVFSLDGNRYNGFVNRINKRATVLVQDNTGREYSDGKKYSKFYVPVQLLRRVG
ncbi:MAG: hypothetical protein ACI9HK_003192 [Pirellulaceae bacterium]|jgi:hypothetical protein